MDTGRATPGPLLSSLARAPRSGISKQVQQAPRMLAGYAAALWISLAAGTAPAQDSTIAPELAAAAPLSPQTLEPVPDSPAPAAGGEIPTATASSGPEVTPVPEALPVGPDLAVKDMQADAGGPVQEAGLSPVEQAAPPMSKEDAESVTKQALENTPRKLAVRAKAGAVYDDNVQLSSAQGESDLILTGGGGFTWTPLMSTRRKLTIDYDGAANFYIDNSDRNGVDHIASIAGFLDTLDTKMSLRGNYSHLTGVDQESRQFDTRDVFALNASLLQHLTGKLYLDASATYSNSAYDALQSTSGLSGSIGLSWAVSAKARVGVSVQAGYTDSDSLGKQDYESALLTANYNASEKLNLAASAGMQRGSTVGNLSDDNESNFVFNVGGSYQLRESTSITFNGGVGSATTAVQDNSAAASDQFNFRLGLTHQFNDRLSGRLTASRSTPASASVANASIENTQFGIGITRSIGPRFSVSLDGGIESADYISTQTGASLGRDEDIFYVRTNFSWKAWENTTFSLFYDYRDVSSTSIARDYEQNRIGLSVGRNW